MLEQLDQQFFIFLNSLNSPFWDKVMFTVSMILIWVPLYIAILIWIGSKYRKKFLVAVLFIAAAVTLSDQSALVIKKSVERPRPCHEPALIGNVHTVNGVCGGKYGFVSSHAANSFNAALLSLMFIRKKWFSAGILLWASVVAYSRIYLGVHYPGDVICGSILGAIIGWGMYKLFELYETRHREEKYPQSPG